MKFGDTKEGMFAIRLAAPLEEEQPKNIPEPKRTGKLVNAQNKSARRTYGASGPNGPTIPARSTERRSGSAIFDHPSNPRFPTYWHARAYGLFATNIFGLHDFENDKARDGSLTIKPGQPLRFRFRVVIHPGDSTAAGLRNLYTAWTGAKEK